jgi:hypothetical protein
MAWEPTTRLQISGYRFTRRRLECALLGRDLRSVNEPIRAPAQSLAVGLALAVILLAGSLVLAYLRPQPASATAPILMEQQSGALYVRVGDVLHPVLNLASARLIAKTSADPQAVAASALERGRRGPQLGIPGAPQSLPTPLGEDELRWTVCDGRGGTTVLVGRDPQARVLASDQTLLVRPSSGGSTYLLAGGHRAVVQRALGSVGQASRPVSSLLLNVIPEAPPLSGFPERAKIPGLPVDASLCAAWTRAPSGDVDVSFSVGGLPLPDGQRPVSLTQADGMGPAVDAVYLPPGRSAYVRATGLSGGNVRAGTRYFISDTGVRYAVHDDDAARDLGMPDATIAAPWPVLAGLPAGPELSRANASVAQDVPAAVRSDASSSYPGPHRTENQHQAQ